MKLLSALGSVRAACGGLIKAPGSALAWTLIAFAALGERAVAADAASNQLEARRHFQTGYELSQAGAFESAAQHFELAYALEPAPGVLYNLGQAYAASGQPVQALRAFRRCLEALDHDASALRERVTAALRVAETRVGRLRIHVTPPEADVYLDGQRLEVASLLDAIELKAGQHVLVSQRAGFEIQSRVIEVPAGSDAVANVVLDPRYPDGHLMITCPVPGVHVHVDGRGEWIAPIATPIAVRPGKYTVRLSRPGYIVEAVAVDVAPAEVAPVRCQSRIDPDASALDMGMLLIEGAPEYDARELIVRIDGHRTKPEFLGGAGGAVALRLPKGPHHVELRRHHYEPWTRTLAIPAGGTLRSTPRWVLTPEYRNELESVTRERTRWATIALGAGAALGVSSAVLAFAASRRHDDWLQERQAVSRSSVGAPGTLLRLRDHHQRALRIQRLNDVAIGLGVLSTGVVGTAAGLLWLSEPTLEGSPAHREQNTGGDWTVTLDGVQLQYRGTL